MARNHSGSKFQVHACPPDGRRVWVRGMVKKDIPMLIHQVISKS